MDPPTLAEIHASAFEPGQGWSAAILAGHMSLPGVYAFFEERGGMVLARIAADEAEILTLAVAPAARRRGIARGLLREVAREAAARGAERIFLEVSAGNVAAAGLYRAEGFLAVGARRGYYEDGSDAEVLAKALKEASSF